MSKIVSKKVTANIEWEAGEAKSVASAGSDKSEALCDCIQYDTLAEAIAAKSEVEVLRVFQVQLDTTTKNVFREEMRDKLYTKNGVEKPGGGAGIQLEAMKRLFMDEKFSDLRIQFVAADGDLPKQKVIATQAMDRVKAERATASGE
jgi:hypothetical protein